MHYFRVKYQQLIVMQSDGTLVLWEHEVLLDIAEVVRHERCTAGVIVGVSTCPKVDPYTTSRHALACTVLRCHLEVRAALEVLVYEPSVAAGTCMLAQLDHLTVEEAVAIREASRCETCGCAWEAEVWARVMVPRPVPVHAHEAKERVAAVVWGANAGTTALHTWHV